MNDEPDDDTLEQTRLLRELTMRPKEVLALRILELTRICNVETGKVAALRAENEALAAELKKGTDTLTLATKTMEHYREALDALRTENERLTQAIGLMTTAKPDMEMNGPDPIGMAHKVVKEVTQLRASLSTADKLAEDREFLKEAAKVVHSKLPDNYGFILLAFPFNNEGDKRLVYVSNGERSACIAVLKEFLLKAGAAEDWMQHIK